MDEVPGARLLASVERALGIPLRLLSQVNEPVRAGVLSAAAQADTDQFRVDLGPEQYLAQRLRRSPEQFLVLGPFREQPDGADRRTVLTSSRLDLATALLRVAAAGLAEIDEQRRERLKVASQLEVISSAAIAVTGAVDLEVVLRRIVDLARQIAGAAYAALGVPDEHGHLAAFLTSGLSPEEEQQIGSPPRGLGILGLLLREPRTIRLRDLRDHPASVGVPANHPPMRSFLGVPIVARGNVVGNLYLTEKQYADEFSADDARLVEMLARHAAVAIENAQLYQQLAHERQRLMVLIDQLPEAVIVAEPGPNRVTLVNRQASQLLGWEIVPPIPLEGFFAMNPRYALRGEEIEPWDIPLFRALHEGRTIARREITLERPDGQRLTILVNGAPLVDEAGDIRAALAVFQDITIIKDAEQLKDDFLSLVSHELRTPLTTIQGGAHMLLHDRELLDQETRDAILGDIAGEGRRLGILVENMVQLANIRAGRFTMETEPVPVERLVRQALTAVAGAAPDREFRMDVQPRLLIDADPQRLDQVIRNLLHNAIKYSPPGQPIEVSARVDGPDAIIAVRDYGPGVSEADLPFLFTRFRRGGAVSSRQEGMGLGLYLSKHLIEAHGGRIWIERAPGGGTIVKFAVPRIEDEEGASGA